MADDTGFGQQDPADMAGKYNGLSFIIAQALSKISTMKIVQVKAVDTAAKTVNVQPMVNQLDGQNNATPHGTIFGIPYAVWQYGTNAVLADPAVDDIGLMIVSDRDISAVKATKAIAPPGSNRQMNVADGVYLGGILNGDPEQWVKFTDAGMEWHDKNGNVLTSSSAGWEFTGPVKFNQAATFMGTIDVTSTAILRGGMQLSGSIVNIGGGRYSGNIDTSGNIISGTISLTGHHHTAQGATAATTVAQA